MSFSGRAESHGDRVVFTDAFSDYAGVLGHATVLRDRDGGIDTINTAALGAASRIDLGAGSGRIDDVRVGFRGSFEAAVGGDGDDLLLGGALAERLAGGRGGDRLAGRSGPDRLLGELGSDLLRGGGDRIAIEGAGFDDLAVRERAGGLHDIDDGERLLLGGPLAAADLAPDDVLLA